MTPDPALLFQRMTRGACRGSVAEEIPTMSRCKGKMEGGARCAVVAARGKDLCTKCEARGAELYDKVVMAPEVKPLRSNDLVGKKRGRPAKKGQISEAEKELQLATELCASCAGENSCNGPGHGVNECAAYSPKEQEAAMAGSASVNEIFYEDSAKKAVLAGGPIDLQISPIADELIKEAATPCAKLSLPLAAILTELPVPTPPLPDTSVVIDLPEDMHEALVGKGVGTATIIELLHVLFISEEYRLVRHAAD